MKLRHLLKLCILLSGVCSLPALAHAAGTTLRIEAGNTVSVTTGGKTWSADSYFSGGSIVDRGNIAIANTTDDKLYQTERYGLTGYALPVVNGNYTVNLHFAETYTGTTRIGQRVFGVTVEGRTLGNIDVFRETGGLNKALVKTTTVSVSDGRLNINFTKISGAPMISAIEVIPADSARTAGQCGPSNGKTFSTVPAEGKCIGGGTNLLNLQTTLSGWTWQCKGDPGAAVASCSAVKKGGTTHPPTTGKARGRVHVGRGTVLSDKNTILRGSSFSLRTTAGNVIQDSYWKHLHEDLKLNALRLGVQTGKVGRTVAQQLPWIDQAVNLAEKNHMYIMIMNSREPGTYNVAELKAFWSVVAPRYKNRTHVFYELTNEAVKGGPVWGDASQYTDKVRADLKSVYDVIRKGAPNTLIAWIDTPNLSPNEPTYTAMLRKIRGADWSNAAIAYHSYTGTWRFGENNLRAMKAKFPLIMTETNYWNEDVRDRPYQRDALMMNEKLGISWFSLGNDGNVHLQNEILPKLHKAGYNWSME